MIHTTKMPLWAAVLACVLAVSCDTPTSEGSGSVYQEPDEVLDTKKFYASDISNNNYYVLTAEKKAIGKRCEVWVEKGGGVTSSDAREIAAEYDTNIDQVIRKAFNIGVIVDTAGTTVHILDAADYFTNKDGKVLLLLLDIRDTYPKDNAYVAGYFGSNDISMISPYSNRADMVYLDIKPGKIKTKQFYATIAHELQHLIHYIAEPVVRSEEQDTWINEGLSSAAEYLYLNNHADTGRIAYFNSGTDDTEIVRGNTFFVWDGALADYVTAYLFFQWLRIQSGSTDIYVDIFMSDKPDHRAVTEAAAKHGLSGDWETLLRSWFAANYINASSGPYGYKGEISYLKEHPTSGSTIQLKPGEGVYSVLGSVPSSGSGDNIRYAGLTKGGTGSVTLGGTGTLTLTYNANDDWEEGGSETGTIAASQPPADTISASRAAAASRGPYPIGISDLPGGRRPGGAALPDDAFSGRIKGFVLNPDE
jgi:hypothetical protein